MSDIELASSAKQGDEAAFAEIVRRYSPRVFQVASRFFRERATVEDAAQEVFLQAYTHLADFAGRGSLEGWLTRIATTTCLNLVRNVQRRPEGKLATLSADSADDLSNEEANWLDHQLADVAAARHRSAEESLVAADLTDRVLAKLSPDDRLVLLMVDGEEMPVKEVAETTGWSESKVKVQAFRARRRMREAIETLLTGRRKKSPDESESKK
ncbi:MAG: sigma-70 family RNA polymerase sigma factor [Acidobacteria bacterium]|nr:sigma-70 family RNA polymerase sigma factor [Acidobacteriota bacterium]